MSYSRGGGAGQTLYCIADLIDPPPKPAGLAGQWMGNWVKFDGATVTIGGLRGDPGPFSQGRGKPLPYGVRLKIDDYQCRSDSTGLYCVNYPHHSAVRIGSSVTTYGCQLQSDHPRSIGEQYDCAG